MSCFGPLRPSNQLTLQQVDSFHRKSIQQSPPLSRRALLSSDQFNGPFESSDPATTPDRRQLEKRPREPKKSLSRGRLRRNRDREKHENEQRGESH